MLNFQVVKFVLPIMAAACLLLAGCGSNLDLSGKGAKTSCLYLETDSLKVTDACESSGLSQIRVYVNNGPKKYYGRLLYQQSWNEPVKRFILPLPMDSLAGRYIQVDLYPGAAAHREMYSIGLEPGDLGKKQRVIARFFGH